MENNNYNNDRAQQQQQQNAQSETTTQKTPIYKKKGFWIGTAAVALTVTLGTFVWKKCRNKKANTPEGEGFEPTK